MGLDLVRNIPQFDLGLLKPSVAIKYRYKNDDWINAIIINSECDKLFIVQYNINYDYSDGYLNLTDVLNNSIEIKILN